MAAFWSFSKSKKIKKNYIFYFKFYFNDYLKKNYFIKVTFCDVNIREQGGRIVRHTMQCVLAVNMFHEKIYIFVWFLLVLLSILNAINILYWTFLCFNNSCSQRFVRQHLTVI